ncbi:MAG: hypothetical protein R2911_33185 [Caldilineaceae bacterium]
MLKPVVTMHNTADPVAPYWHAGLLAKKSPLPAAKLSMITWRSIVLATATLTNWN